MTQRPTPADTIARYERFLAADPDNALLRKALGDLYHQGGELERARDAFEHCVARDPSDAAARGRLAGVFLSMHRFDEAERSYRSLLGTGGQDPALLHGLGLALYHQQRWAEAADALGRARDAGLAAPDNLRHLAYALHHRGDTAAALRACDAWLALAPSAAAAGYRALLQLDTGDVDAAARTAREVLAQAPDDANANLALGWWEVEAQHADDAAARFERVARDAPGDARAWFGIALVRLLREDRAGAIAAFRRVLEITPDNAGAIVAMGWAQFLNEEIYEAERTFRRAVKVERNFGEAHAGVAVTLVWQNRRDEARREIAIARRLDPQGFGMIYARSVLLGVEGKREMAERLMTQGMERAVRAGGPALIDSVRVFLRKRVASAPDTIENRG